CYDWDGDGRWDHNTIVMPKDPAGMLLVNAHTVISRHRYWIYLDSHAWTPNTPYSFYGIEGKGKGPLSHVVGQRRPAGRVCTGALCYNWKWGVAQPLRQGFAEGMSGGGRRPSSHRVIALWGLRQVFY